MHLHPPLQLFSFVPAAAESSAASFSLLFPLSCTLFLQYIGVEHQQAQHECEVLNSEGTVVGTPRVGMREVMGADRTLRLNLGNHSRKELVSSISCNFRCDGHPLIPSSSAGCEQQWPDIIVRGEDVFALSNELEISQNMSTQPTIMPLKRSQQLILIQTSVTASHPILKSDQHHHQSRQLPLTTG